MRKATFIDEIIAAGWTAQSTTGDKIVFIKSFGGRKHARIITLAFEIVGEGKYRIVHPSYDFHSTASHFKAICEDKRLSLNKGYLTRIVKDLKRLKLWDFVENKEFLAPNDWNKNSNKAKIRSELKELLS